MTQQKLQNIDARYTNHIPHLLLIQPSVIYRVSLISGALFLCHHDTGRPFRVSVLDDTRFEHGVRHLALNRHVGR